MKSHIQWHKPVQLISEGGDVTDPVDIVRMDPIPQD